MQILGKFGKIDSPLSAAHPKISKLKGAKGSLVMLYINVPVSFQMGERKSEETHGVRVEAPTNFWGTQGGGGRSRT